MFVREKRLVVTFMTLVCVVTLYSFHLQSSHFIVALFKLNVCNASFLEINFLKTACFITECCISIETSYYMNEDPLNFSSFLVILIGIGSF